MILDIQLCNQSAPLSLQPRQHRPRQRLGASEVHGTEAHHLQSWYGYGSIPINSIFRGMNIHKSQLFWCEQKRGTIGFDTLPYKVHENGKFKEAKGSKRDCRVCNLIDEVWWSTQKAAKKKWQFAKNGINQKWESAKSAHKPQGRVWLCWLAL